jgi:hypothetical protein
MMNQCLRPILGGLFLTALVSQVTETMPDQQVTANGRQCDVAPRSYANITSLLGSPPEVTPPATTGGETLESGTQASGTDRQEMRAVIDEWLACQNEGRLFSAWALFSDAYLYRLISRQPPMTEAFYEDWAMPQPLESATAHLLEISGERRLSDGRLGATVRISYTSIPMPKQFFFYFTEQEETLLIDSILGEISFSVP